MRTTTRVWLPAVSLLFAVFWIGLLLVLANVGAYAAEPQTLEEPKGINSIGDLVWRDTTPDGAYDLNAESGINGVTVQLYLDDGDKVFEPGVDTLIETTVTVNNPNSPSNAGWYEFADLDTSGPNVFFWVDVPVDQPALDGLRQTNAAPENPALVPFPTDAAHEERIDFGFARVGIKLQKTIAYGSYEPGTCPGVEKLTGEPGMDITYCFEITNTGDTDLQPVVITDTLLNLPTATVQLQSDNYPPLAAGESAIWTFNTQIVTDVVNTAQVSGVPVDDDGFPIEGVTPPEDEDQAEVDGVRIEILLQKTAYIGHDSGVSCASAGSDFTTGLTGADLTYCFKVTNEGESWISYVSFLDTDLGINSNDVDLVSGSGSLPLAPGESIIYYYDDDGALTVDKSLVNTATATGTPTTEDGREIPVDENPKSTDTTDVRLADPQITFEKGVYLGHNGGAGCGTAADSVVGVVNAEITYCFKVTNSSTNAAVSQTVVTDADLGITATNVASGALPLQPGQSITYYHEATLDQDLNNTASVTATPTDLQGDPIPGTGPLEKTNDADVYVANPQFEFVKSVYSGHNDGASCGTNTTKTVLGIKGGEITYCFAVTNTSPQAYVSSIRITDATLSITEADMEQDPANVIPLPPGETAIYYVERTIDGDMQNAANATVTPSDPQGVPIPGLDDLTKTSIVNVLEASPDIEIEKTVYEDDDGGASCPGEDAAEIANGSKATFCFLATNTGENAYLDKIAIYDPLLGITQVQMVKKSGNAPLAPKASILYYYVLEEVEGSLENVATVTAIPADQLGTPIPGAEKPASADKAKIVGVGPGIDIRKTVYAGQDSGASCPGSESLVDSIGAEVTYCFAVKNTGDVYRLNPILVTDPQLGITQADMKIFSGSVPLAPGASIVFYYETTVTGPLANTAAASGTLIDENGDPVQGSEPPADADTANVDVPNANTIGDFVWNDVNADGIQDDNEPGLAGITVILYDFDGNEVDTTTTDANGFYAFTNVQPGRYYLEFELPNDLFVFTQQYAGNDPEKDSDVNPLTGRTDVFTLQDGVVDNTRAAGMVASPKLAITKTANVASAETDNTVSYVLTYGNSGLSAAPEVVIEETVPNGTIFEAGKSTPGWDCPDGSPSGTKCAYAAGALDPDETGNVLFAAKLVDDLRTEDVVVNRVTIYDAVYEEIRQGLTLGEDFETVLRQPTAVVLARFVASSAGNSIRLEWTTVSEQDTAGFHIYRSTSTRQKSAAQITESLILALGPSGGSYSFVDRSALPGVAYYYWLVETETDDDILWYGPVSSVLASDSGLQMNHHIYLPLMMK